MWTQFMDMHSGGGQKEEWAYIYIEAPKEEAQVIFYNRFGHNPNRVTCTCCGEDYSISSDKTLAKLTAYNRGIGSHNFHKRQTLAAYRKNNDVLMIKTSEIREEEKHGSIPNQGYIWID